MASLPRLGKNRTVSRYLCWMPINFEPAMIGTLSSELAGGMRIELLAELLAAFIHLSCGQHCERLARQFADNAVARHAWLWEY